ncbi:MAG: hypothetical protein GTO22_05590 [Gemmatimonadales bacterium]|nr:hypothetical protein [Gemmatimonadales bacterium]
MKSIVYPICTRRTPSLLCRSLVGAAVVLLSGCQGKDRPAEPIVLDSAGTAIITSSASDHALDWSLRPILRLGGKEAGPESFYRVTARLAAVDAAGNMFVLDPVAARLHRFGPDGAHHWTVGSRGGGPGEFQMPVAVTVGYVGGPEVQDVRKLALVRFDSTGAALDEIRMGRGSARVQWLATGRVLETQRYTKDGRVVQLRLQTDADTLELARTRSAKIAQARLEGCGPVPMLVRPIIVAPELAWDVHDSLIAMNSQAGYVINILDQRARVLRSIRREWPSRLATQADAEDWAREHPIRITRTGASGECRISPQEMVSKIGYADSLPSVAAVVLAPDGALWVRRWTMQEDAAPIDVFDPTGRYVGTLSGEFPFPMHFTPEGHMLFAERDSLDVERVIVAEIVRD